MKILKNKKTASVTELAEEIGITLKNTSRNLTILTDLDLVQFKGRDGKVFYSLNSNPDADIKKVLQVII